jgi:hypothetical protein
MASPPLRVTSFSVTLAAAWLSLASVSLPSHRHVRAGHCVASRIADDAVDAGVQAHHGTGRSPPITHALRVLVAIVGEDVVDCLLVDRLAGAEHSNQPQAAALSTKRSARCARHTVILPARLARPRVTLIK